MSSMMRSTSMRHNHLRKALSGQPIQSEAATSLKSLAGRRVKPQSSSANDRLKSKEQRKRVPLVRLELDLTLAVATYIDMVFCEDPR